MTIEEWKRKNPPIQRKTRTNYDRIISKTPEELTEIMMEVQQDIADYLVRPPEYPTMKALWLDWLKQEAKTNANYKK